MIRLGRPKHARIFVRTPASTRVGVRGRKKVLRSWLTAVRRFRMSCVFIPVKSNRFQKGDLVRFPFGEAGGRADGTVVATGVSFGLRRKVRVETVAAQFEIDEADVQLVSRSSLGQA